jgi:hypothetical protein
MALDMESEFYKLAKDILSKTQNLYKMAGISPKDGRLSLMGAEGFLVVPRRLLERYSRGTEERAYELGLICGEDIFGGLLNEFDEEIKELPPKKLIELAILLTKQVGWGSFEAVKVDESGARATLKGAFTLELKNKSAKHHSLTCGYMAGVMSKAFRRTMKGTVGEIGKDSVTFHFSCA